MYDFDIKTVTSITRYKSYKNISIEPGETWNYIFKAPESTDSQYLGVDLLSVRCGENFTSYSHSSTWIGRRDDTYRIYETKDGIDVDWLDEP